MTTHRISPTPQTVRWGTFDAAYPPLLTIPSGDTVVLECVSGAPEVMPPTGSGFTIPPALAAIHAANIPRAGGHIITGPVAVAGAEPGDMLEVRIDHIEIGNDWGYCGFRPLRRHAAGGFSGTLPQPHPGRPGQGDLPAALGHRTPPGAVLRRDGRGTAARLGHHLHDPAAPARRQPRQQGTDRGVHPVPAGLGRGRAVLRRRRPRRAGRRRGLHQRAGNLPDRHLHPDPAQGRRPARATADLSAGRNRRRTSSPWACTRIWTRR